MTFRMVDFIVKKRDGGTHTREELETFIREYVADIIPDYQASAWCMAVYFQGMTPEETAHLTYAMAHSGETLDLHDVAPIIVDKHSSGGVGDKTTLAVAPIVAATGLPVGKMSGRGLAHTGGTLDKLESFRGFRTELSFEEFKRQLREVGLVIAGATHNLAPADKKLYALRDVTGTVPSIPLIASSIMSKKIATGSDAIVLDVKVGKGAFMKTLEDARVLAQLMVDIGSHLGRRMAAVLSDMNQPLGRTVGNALEVKEAIATLHGRGPEDFTELVHTVAGEMIRLGGKAATREEARALVDQVIADGSAFRKFRQFIVAQGGDPRQVDNPDLLPKARLVIPIESERSGFVQDIDAYEVGLVTMILGGGREKKGDPIDHAVGVVLHKKVGDRVSAGEPLCEIHANDETRLQEALDRLRGAIRVGEEPVEPWPIVYEIVED
ncbi:MAG: pyrimidine-nucleoside phosphorylase [Chloroflexi bacterium]|nr:pyrimidine-nucleoside phosphorylase [Chloroflexota bacterium]